MVVVGYTNGLLTESQSWCIYPFVKIGRGDELNHYIPVIYHMVMWCKLCSYIPSYLVCLCQPPGCTANPQCQCDVTGLLKPLPYSLKRCMTDLRRNLIRTGTQNAATFLPFLLCIVPIFLVLVHTFAARLNASCSDTSSPISAGITEPWSLDFACRAYNW